MKHRTKNNPSDDFKFVVNYELDLSKEEQKQLDTMVPSTPVRQKKDDTSKNGNYNLLASD